MNTRNKIITAIFAGILTSALLAFPLFHAAAASREGSRRRTEKIPDSALLPPYDKQYIDGKIKEFTDWATADFPADFSGKRSVHGKQEKENASGKSVSGKKKKSRKHISAAPGAENSKEKKKEYRFTQIEFRRRFSCFESFLGSNPGAMDDLEEVTGVKREYFISLANAAWHLFPYVRGAEAARNAGNEEYFRSVMKEYRKALKYYEECRKAKPKRLTSREADQLAEKNEKRRKTAYLAERKRQRELQKQQARKMRGTSEK